MCVIDWVHVYMYVGTINATRRLLYIGLPEKTRLLLTKETELLAYLPQQCYRYMARCYSFRRARSLYSSSPNP